MGSADQITALKDKLARLELSLEELITGKRISSMSYDGNSVQNASTVTDDTLRRAIAETRRELNRAQGKYIGPRAVFL